MRQSDVQLKDYLAPDESLKAVSPGTLHEQASWTPMSIGVTDRRLLCVADEGRHVTVGYDDIRTIRSRPLTTRTYRGIWSLLLLGSGALLAVLGIASLLAFAPSALATLLTLMTVGGVLAAEYLRRETAEIGWGPVTDITAHVPDPIDRKAVHQRYTQLISDAMDETQVLLVGSAVVAVLSFIGLLILKPSGIVVLSALSTVIGLAVVDYRKSKAKTHGLSRGMKPTTGHQTTLQ